MITPIEILLAFTLDLMIGDPRWLPHPVQAIGICIERAETFLRRLLPARLGGILLTIIIVIWVYSLTYLITSAIRHYIGGTAGSLVIIFIASTTLALRGLIVSVLEVFRSTSLDEARQKLSMIVGRDTESLDEDGVYRASIETLAENTSDGVIAPLLYLAIGGLPLAMAYKSINTLDSMVGYKNDKYIEFGWASARLDDAANYIPARLTGLLIVLASLFIGKASAPSAMRIMLRDGNKHSSPNSGIPEAAMAGALGVMLGGSSTYGGVEVDKPTIGNGGSTKYKSRRSEAIKITALAGFVGFGISALIAYTRTQQ